jgi:hypothetical protein
MKQTFIDTVIRLTANNHKCSSVQLLIQFEQGLK